MMLNTAKTSVEQCLSTGKYLMHYLIYFKLLNKIYLKYNKCIILKLYFFVSYVAIYLIFHYLRM